MGLIVLSHLKIKNCNLSEKEADDRYEDPLDEFMKRGPCKEEYMNYQNCMYKKSSRESSKKLDMCMEAHSDYYQPALDIYKSAEKFFKERVEKDIKHSDTPIDEIDKFWAVWTEDSCRESFTDWAVYCILEKKKKNNEEVNCEELFSLFMECVDAHPDHSLYAVKKATEEHIEKEAKALLPEMI